MSFLLKCHWIPTIWKSPVSCGGRQVQDFENTLNVTHLHLDKKKNDQELFIFLLLFYILIIQLTDQLFCL